MGRRRIDGKRSFCQDHAVLFPRRRDRNAVIAHIFGHGLRIALERRTESAGWIAETVAECKKAMSPANGNLGFAAVAVE